MSNKKHSLTTYVQNTLMQYLPSMTSSSKKNAAVTPPAVLPTSNGTKANKPSTPTKGKSEPQSNGHAHQNGKKKPIVSSATSKSKSSLSVTKSESAGQTKSKYQQKKELKDDKRMDHEEEEEDEDDEEVDEEDTDEDDEEEESNNKKKSSQQKSPLKSLTNSANSKKKSPQKAIPSSNKKTLSSKNGSNKKGPSPKKKVITIESDSDQAEEEEEDEEAMDTDSDAVDEEDSSSTESEDESSKSKSNGKSSSHTTPNKKSTSSKSTTVASSKKTSSKKSLSRSRSRSRSPKATKSSTSNSKSRSRSKSPVLSTPNKKSNKSSSASATKSTTKATTSAKKSKHDSSSSDEASVAMSDVDSDTDDEDVASPSKSKSKGRKRKHISVSDDDERDSETDAHSHRSATPPLPPTSRLHTNSPFSAQPVSSDDEADVEPDRRTPSKVKHIDHVQIGNYELTTWYHSPYPDAYRTAKKLFICQYCLKYCKEYKSMEVHQKECHMTKPPGKLIYQDGKNSVFEVDGSLHKLYCQCLCLFAKLFIDHKTLYYDVDPFLFYVLTETVPNESASKSSSTTSSSSTSAAASSSSNPPVLHQVVGYFSKEKQSPDQFNVSCILTFPQYQRKGYGKFLIALSYELSRREKRIGSPEKPLSDLGKVSYKSYWVNELLTLIASDPKNQSLSILDICNATSIKKEDVISALESVQLIKYVNGEHQLDCGSKASKEILAKHKQKLQHAKNHPNTQLLEFQPNLLKWQSKIPAQTSSPSVAFPTPSSPAAAAVARAAATSSGKKTPTSSRAKKRIKY